MDTLKTMAPLVYDVFTVIGKVGDRRSMLDKRIHTAVGLSVVFTGRSQRFKGQSKVLGVSFVLMGIHRGILNMLTNATVLFTIDREQIAR